MPLAEKTVPVKFKPGPKIEKDVDGEKKLVDGPPVPAMHVTIRELSALDAMDADDLALEMAQMQDREPSRPRIIKTYGLCSVVAVDGEPIAAVRSVQRLKELTERIGTRGVDLLAGEFLAFSGEIAKMADPKDSPSEKPSDS